MPFDKTEGITPGAEIQQECPSLDLLGSKDASDKGKGCDIQAAARHSRTALFVHQYCCSIPSSLTCSSRCFINCRQIPKHFAAPRTAWIDLSASGDAKDCLLFLDGELYRDRVKASDRISDAQADGTLPALNRVFLSSVSAANRQVEYICNGGFASFLGTDMPRWIKREVGIHDRLFLCGLSLSALQAVYTAVLAPGIFAGVLAQSPSAWWQDEWLACSMPPAGTMVNKSWLSVGIQELDENVSHPPTPLIQRRRQLASVHRLAKRMTDAGHEIHCHEYDGGHDPVCWSDELPSALAWLLE